MTNGSSQGLFVIVAVVIFGIFVFISYIIFQGKLKTGLSAIFCDSFIETSKNSGFELKKCGSEKEEGLSKSEVLNSEVVIESKVSARYQMWNLDASTEYKTQTFAYPNAEFTFNSPKTLDYHSRPQMCSSGNFEYVLDEYIYRQYESEYFTIDISNEKVEDLQKSKISVDLNGKSLSIEKENAESGTRISLNTEDMVSKIKFKGFKDNPTLPLLNTKTFPKNELLTYPSSGDVLTITINGTSTTLPITHTTSWDISPC